MFPVTWKCTNAVFRIFEFALLNSTGVGWYLLTEYANNFFKIMNLLMEFLLLSKIAAETNID